jgi:glycosyltransferase involved in cell wall biosynthesis/SAM-dependent methyltransferase
MAEQLKRRALLSYITAPFRTPADQVTGFSNFGIARNLVRVLAALGYEVDVVEYSTMNYRADAHYDLFVGHGGMNWEHLSRTVARDAVKVYFATGAHWRLANRAAAERHAAFEARRGIRLPYERWVTYSEEFAYHDADGIVCLGNKQVVEGFPEHPLCIPINNATYPDGHYAPGQKDFESGRHRFLFFGSVGSLHKGLDLVLEAFSELDAELYCAGRFEPAFLDAYRHEIETRPTIKIVGWVPFGSAAYYELMNRCNFVILPSCAEGQPGSVLDAMNLGLIPIVSKACHINVEPFGVEIDPPSIKAIRDCVQRMRDLPVSWQRERSRQAREACLRDHSEEGFVQELRRAIETIIRAAPAARAERRRRALAAGEDVRRFLSEQGENLGALLDGAQVLKERADSDGTRLLLRRATHLEPQCSSAWQTLAELDAALSCVDPPTTWANAGLKPPTIKEGRESMDSRSVASIWIDRLRLDHDPEDVLMIDACELVQRGVGRTRTPTLLVVDQVDGVGESEIVGMIERLKEPCVVALRKATGAGWQSAFRRLTRLDQVDVIFRTTAGEGFSVLCFDPTVLAERERLAPWATRVFIDGEGQTHKDAAAVERLQRVSDRDYLQAGGTIRVTRDRWRVAQEYERKTWMERGLALQDDRHGEHLQRYDNYRSLSGRKFQRPAELGCGPFTNIRQLLPFMEPSAQVTLLDPLIEQYLHHPHCAYAGRTLGSLPVETVALPIEEYEPISRFDLVLMTNVLEHCFDVPRIFDNILTMLAPAGVLILGDSLIPERAVRSVVENLYDAGHPIRVTEEYVMSFLDENFSALYKRKFYGLYGQSFRVDLYYVGEKDAHDA